MTCSSRKLLTQKLKTKIPRTTSRKPRTCCAQSAAFIWATMIMKSTSNNSGVSQRRILWFAIALALAITVSGFGRFAAAQQPSPRAKSEKETSKSEKERSKSDKDAASRKSDLIDDENLFSFEPK